jgi:hypothetical protein
VDESDRLRVRTSVVGKAWSVNVEVVSSHSRTHSRERPVSSLASNTCSPPEGVSKASWREPDGSMLSEPGVEGVIEAGLKASADTQRD